MNKIKHIITSLLVLGSVAAGMLYVVPTPVHASAKDSITSGVNATGLNNDKNCTNAKGKAVKCSFGDIVKNIVNIMLFIIGALSVILIVFGGIRYTTSAGDSSRVKAAKDTIMYAVIGLVVALLAYAIVNFVLTSLT